MKLRRGQAPLLTFLSSFKLPRNPTVPTEWDAAGVCAAVDSAGCHRASASGNVGQARRYLENGHATTSLCLLRKISEGFVIHSGDGSKQRRLTFIIRCQGDSNQVIPVISWPLQSVVMPRAVRCLAPHTSLEMPSLMLVASELRACPFLCEGARWFSIICRSLLLAIFVDSPYLG